MFTLSLQLGRSDEIDTRRDNRQIGILKLLMFVHVVYFLSEPNQYMEFSSHCIQANIGARSLQHSPSRSIMGCFTRHPEDDT